MTMLGEQPSVIGALGDPAHEGEIAWFSRQQSEHALFMHIGFEVEPWKRDAGLLFRNWERARADPRLDVIIPLAQQLRLFQVEAFKCLNRGEWLGWLWASFVDHITHELDLGLAHLTTGVAPTDELCTWIHLLQEHADFTAHLLDPTEKVAITRASDMAIGFAEMVPVCRASDMQFIALTEKAGAQLNQFLANDVKLAKSVIHPVLQIHLLREGLRFLAVAQSLRSREPLRF